MNVLQTASTGGTVQFDLLLRKLRQLVLTGTHPDRAADMLGRTEMLEHLDARQILDWASCAQIAGQDGVVRQCFSRLHTDWPDFEEAWVEHRDYLQALNDGAGLAALRALCREQAPQHAALFAASPAPAVADENDIPDGPFAVMQREDQRLQLFRNTFRGREDCFARQWADKAEGKSGYVPVRRPLQDSDLRDHLAGRRTYGVYLLQADGLCRLGVIDADLHRDLRSGTLPAARKADLRRELAWMLERIPEVAGEMGLHCITEFSGSKGYHFWFALDRAVEPVLIRRVLQVITDRVKNDLQCFGLEVFPKQDSLSGKGLGNLVKLPLGLHRLSGKPSRFPGAGRGDVWQQLAWLEGCRLNNADSLTSARTAPKATVIEHPLLQQWKQDWPELAELGAACPLMAQLFAVCREGRALSLREERVVYGVLGFLDRRKTLLHAVLSQQPEYNPHMVDYRLSRLRGTVLGCKKIHALLESSRDFCTFPAGAAYGHPLLFVSGWNGDGQERSETVTNLQDALQQLRQSLDLVVRMLPS